MHGKYVVVAGATGVGKSTVATHLAEILGCRAFLEDFASNPFLERFFADPQRWALHSQLYFLNQTISQQREIASLGGGVQDHSMYEVHYGFNAVLLDRGVLDIDSHSLLDDVVRGVSAVVRKPDLVVLLLAPAAELMARIRGRGRHFEQEIDEDFLAQLATQKAHYWQSQDEVPVLAIDTTRYKPHVAADMADLAASVVSRLGADGAGLSTDGLPRA